MTTRADRNGVVVMKFGGTSVADPEKIQRAAERALAERRKGRGVVVVVSAPGDMTDELLTLAERVSARQDARELDQLMTAGEQVSIALFAMACGARGAPAVSLTGPQAGIEAAGVHGDARIRLVRTAAIRRELAAGRIVVVAGFQARLGARDVATLGRGGSDLTAVALASALRARACEIFTDVKGVYTADPRVVYEARRLETVTFDEMLELAGAGAQVMQSRSLEVARRSGVSIHVRSAFHPIPGTWIVPGRTGTAARAAVSALALDKSAGAKLSVVGRGLRSGPDAERTLRETLAAHKIGGRLISASDLRLTVAVDARHAEAAMRALHSAYGLAKKPRRRARKA